jgi:hypothetical protein
MPTDASYNASVYAATISQRRLGLLLPMAANREFLEGLRMGHGPSIGLGRIHALATDADEGKSRPGGNVVGAEVTNNPARL